MALITTTRGLMEADLLDKLEGIVDNDNEHTTWVEYWHEGECIHRSAHVTLKRHPTMTINAGEFFRG